MPCPLTLTLGRRTAAPAQVSNRVFFAGEGTSRFRFGYVDGAYETGIREAKRILALSANHAAASGALPYAPPEEGFRPSNDAEIRADWFQAVKELMA